MRHVVFRVNRDRYALPLSTIREVLDTPDQVTGVPRAPAVLTGVMNLRGRVVPLVDLSQLLELGPLESEGDRVVLLDRGRGDLGLRVSDIEGVETIERMARGAGKNTNCIKGIARIGALVVTVLDADEIDSAVAAACGGKS